MTNKTDSRATLFRFVCVSCSSFQCLTGTLACCLCVVYTHLEQMTSWEVWAAGSSFSRLLERSMDCRWRRPQGTTEGRAVRQLDDRSRCVIRDDRSMNQSSSNQGSCRPLQSTPTACAHVDIRSKPSTIESYFRGQRRDSGTISFSVWSSWISASLPEGVSATPAPSAHLFFLGAWGFLYFLSEKVFAEGWVVHQSVGGKPCSLLQQEVSYFFITWKKETPHSTASNRYISTSIYLNTILCGTMRRMLGLPTCSCSSVQWQPSDDSKLIAVDGTVFDICVIAVDQQSDHVQVTLLTRRSQHPVEQVLVQARTWGEGRCPLSLSHHQSNIHFTMSEEINRYERR